MARTNFIIIGAQRAATTYLAAILDRHPEIEMAKPFLPEPKYLLQKVEYSSHFKTNKVCGEKTTSYMYDDKIPAKLKKIMSNCKIVVVLRNPVERAISHYSMSCFHKLEIRNPQSAFFGEVPKTPLNVSMSPYAYLEYSQYMKYIRPFMNLFPVKIALYEEVIDLKLDELFAFLNVEKCEIKPMKKIHSYPKQSMPLEILDKLQRYFEPSIQQVEEEINLCLDHWR